LSTAAVTGKKLLGVAMQRASTMSKQADVVFDGLVASASDAVDRLRADLNIVPSDLPTLDDAVLNPTTTIAEAKQRAATATAGIVNAIRVGSESAREGLREKAGGALEAYKAVASDLKIRASEAIAKGKEAVGDRPASLLLNQLASLSSVPQPSSLAAPLQQKAPSNHLDQVVSGGGEMVEEETLKEAAGFAIGAADEEDVNSPSASSVIPPAGISSFSSSSSSSTSSTNSDLKNINKGSGQTSGTSTSKLASGASAAARTLLSGAKSALLSAAEIPPPSSANSTSTAAASSVIGAGLKRLNSMSSGVVSISQLVSSANITSSSSSSSGSGGGGKIVDSLRTLASVPVATNATTTEPKTSFRVSASTLFEAAKSKIATATSVPQATSPTTVAQATNLAAVAQGPSSSPSSSPVLTRKKQTFPCQEEVTMATAEGSVIEMHSCKLELFGDSLSVITESSPSRTVTKTVKIRSLEKVSTSKKRPERLALIFSKPPVVVIADDNDDDDDHTSAGINEASLNRVVLIFTCGEDASMFLCELQELASSQ
jgi:trimeric autotransporter adhesin